ncbi:MAG: hypothetical protein OES09_09290 [Gammaproteobacteria bacterium]|nr:hypothetical protein [Gammaproteobacteria bacterium]
MATDVGALDVEKHDVAILEGRTDDCSSFGESQCMRGGMGRISANAFLLTVLDNMGRLSNYTASDNIFVRRA